MVETTISVFNLQCLPFRIPIYAMYDYDDLNFVLAGSSCIWPPPHSSRFPLFALKSTVGGVSGLNVIYCALFVGYPNPGIKI